MKLKELIEALDLKVLSETENTDQEVKGAYVSDLLSDVMGHAKEGEIWITLQAHSNVIAIASLKDLPAIILVKGIEPESEVLQKAREEGIVVLGTEKSTFSIAGCLYSILNK